MDKRTILALVICTVILIVWFKIQSLNNPIEASTPENTITTQSQTDPSFYATSKIIPAPLSTDKTILANTKTSEEQEIIVNTDVYRIVFSSKNGTIRSLKLHTIENNNVNDDNSIELFPMGDKDQAFRILWGDTQDTQALQDVYYNVARPNKDTIEFYQDFVAPDGSVFGARKIYTIKESEYVIELKIQLKNKRNDILKIADNYTYSLMFGPQLGPLAEIIDTQKSKQLSRRRLVGFDSKKVRNINVKANNHITKNLFYKWVGISGRYISMLILTGSTSYTSEFSAYSVEGLNSGAQVLLRRPEIQSSAVEDKFRIYIGPNVRKTLANYNNTNDNAFNIQGANFNAITPRRLLSFLERPLYGLMKLIYRIIPNYGIAIVVLTLLMRLLTLPIIKKSKVNSEKMKHLSPKMKALRTKYAGDTVRMNQEIMGLYKKEKISPFSSMMPLFIQIPFFLAMYRVIYESFDLWQAPFVGWIKDLSAADQLVSFGDFSVPLLGWTGLNLLPIIMLGTQYVSSFIMMKQQDTSAGSSQMIFIMSYVFPFMIFFALYNSPSGLIVYWICSNLFTVLTMINWKKKDPIDAQSVLVKKKSKINFAK